MLSQNFKYARFAGIAACLAVLLGVAVFPVLKGSSAPLSTDDARAEMKAVKAEMESGTGSEVRYRRLADVLNKCTPINQVIDLAGKDELAPQASLCITGASLALADPTFNRMQTQSTGNGFGPAGSCTLSGSGTAVHYDFYSFNLTGCAAFPTVVTMTLCGPAGCTPTGNTDAMVILYRNVPAGDPLTANGGLPGVFNPAAACTNARGLNDDLDTAETATGGSSCNQTVTSDCLAVCSGGLTSVGGMKRNLGNGRFTVVIAGFGNSTTGTYNLYVDAPAAGCSVALAPSAASAEIGGRVATQNGRGIGKAVVTITGGNLPAPIVSKTNPFGYYNFPNLESGLTYTVSVAAKGYTFTNPTRIISLQDAVSDADFTSIE